MARRPNDELLYPAFQKFLNRCLINDNSLIWPDRKSWTKNRVINVKESVVDSPIWGNELSFKEKLKEQMKDASSDHWAIIADIFYVYFLPSSYIKLETDKKGEELWVRRD